MLQPKCVCDSPLASSCPSLSLCVLLGCSSFCGRKKKKKRKVGAVLWKSVSCEAIQQRLKAAASKAKRNKRGAKSDLHYWDFGVLNACTANSIYLFMLAARASSTCVLHLYHSWHEHCVWVEHRGTHTVWPKFLRYMYCTHLLHANEADGN